MAASSIANKMVMLITAMLMIQSVLSAQCSKKKANGAYTSQVVEVVLALQREAPNSADLAATHTSNGGSVTGRASCTTTKSDPTAAANDCSGCLGVATGELTTGNCKGKKTGSSKGNSGSGLDGNCNMIFGPA